MNHESTRHGAQHRNQRVKKGAQCCTNRHSYCTVRDCDCVCHQGHDFPMDNC